MAAVMGVMPPHHVGVSVAALVRVVLSPEVIAVLVQLATFAPTVELLLLRSSSLASGCLRAFCFPRALLLSLRLSGVGSPEPELLVLPAARCSPGPGSGWDPHLLG